MTNRLATSQIRENILVDSKQVAAQEKPKHNIN